MRKNDLLAAVAKIPGNPVVAIFDSEANAADQIGGVEDGSTVGVIVDFEVIPMGKDMIPKGGKPWIALAFQAKKEAEA